MASTSLITFGSQCPPDPCQPCGCRMLQYGAVIYGAYFAPLFVDFSIPPAQLPNFQYLTKTIHIEWTPPFSPTTYTYDCTIKIDPLTNDVSISDSGIAYGYDFMTYVINNQFQGVTYSPTDIAVDVRGSFNGDIAGFVSLSNPWDRGQMQQAIDELLNQLSWDDVRNYLKDFSADPLNAGQTLCAICVNWKNHYRNGNGAPYDLAFPWTDGIGNPGAIQNFFGAPLPQVGAPNPNLAGLFDANGHMISPYLTTIGSKTLEVGLMAGVFGASEAGNLLISFVDPAAQLNQYNSTNSFYELLATKLFVNVGGDYCDDALAQIYVGGDPQPPTENRANITLAQNTEIPNLPFVWLDNYEWQALIDEYSSGHC